MQILLNCFFLTPQSILKQAATHRWIVKFFHYLGPFLDGHCAVQSNIKVSEKDTSTVSVHFN